MSQASEDKQRCCIWPSRICTSEIFRCSKLGFLCKAVPTTSRMNPKASVAPSLKVNDGEGMNDSQGRVSLPQKQQPTNLTPSSLALPSNQDKVRKYVPLKPGRSLMDWIRFTNSGADLSGTKGHLFDVSEDELAKHNKITDAWIGLKGRVYNITSYLEYHPGGIDILLPAIGKESTDLFMQNHKWVNFETMLEKCLIGRLVVVSSPVRVFKKRDSDIQKRRKLLPKLTSNFLSPNDVLISSVPSAPRCDWYQSEESVTIVIYTSISTFRQEDVIVDKKTNEEIIITVYVNEHVFYYNIELHQPVCENYEISIGSNGKLEIILYKKVSTNWLTIGSPLNLHKHYIPIYQTELNLHECRLVSKRPLTSNTCFFTFELPQSFRMIVPVAKHVVLTLNNNDRNLSRSYTPVPASVNNEENDIKNINFIIKIYEDGIFTPHLNRLNIGSTILVSNYFGTFSTKKLDGITHFIGLAAGTGITPFLSILHHGLTRNCFKFDYLKVVNFNKTENDIILKEELEKLAEASSSLEIKFVVAEPLHSWQGEIASSVSKSLLSEIVPVCDKIKKLICVCGPTDFNRKCTSYLEELGVAVDEIFVFSNEQHS